MATKTRTKAAEESKILGVARGTGLANAERVAFDQAQRSSGAAGPHAKSGVHRSAAGGRKTKMGSRRARTAAAVRDFR